MYGQMVFLTIQLNWKGILTETLYFHACINFATKILFIFFQKPLETSFSSDFLCYFKQCSCSFGEIGIGIHLYIFSRVFLM